MKNKIWLSTFREIRNSLGRYIAFLIIVALGVGFFAGLKVTEPAMRQSVNQYLVENQFYDFRLISSYGFEKEDIDRLNVLLKEDIPVREIEGSVSADVIVELDKVTKNLKAIAIPQKINTPVVVSGRLPQAADECVLDSNYFGESMIGKDIVLSSLNEQDTLDMLNYDSFHVVGLVSSPLYIQYERGSTSLGNGVLDAFMYAPMKAFDVDYFTDCYVKLESDYPIFSDEYKEEIDRFEDRVEEILDVVSTERFQRIVSDAQAEVDDAKKELEDEKEEALLKFADAKRELEDAKASIEENEKKLFDAKSSLDDLQKQIDQANAANSMMPGMVDSATIAFMQQSYEEGIKEYEAGVEKLEEGKQDYQDGLKEYEDNYAKFESEIADAKAKIDEAQQEIDDLDEPITYMFGRDGNVGYVCFESDSSIVDAIANVFPVFFFLVAALVCATTMNRMVEDQRTQIGVLKALGYSDGKIMLKFLVYSGSAAFIGALIGFFCGTVAFPKAIWTAYKMMYNTGEISYFYSVKMLIISFIVAFACSIGVTFVTCRLEVTQMAAGLMRPKAPKAGKRILLERIPLIWNHVSFLKKVSLRNIFRYKSRLLMMVLGIGGCTALLVAGLGIYDSIGDIAHSQYTGISKYDISVTLRDEYDKQCKVMEELDIPAQDYILFYETSVTLSFEGEKKNVRLNVFEDENSLENFFDLHSEKGEPIEFPKMGEAVVNAGLAKEYDIHVGDVITLGSESMKEFEVKVTGLNQNFIYNYVYISRSTFEGLSGEQVHNKNIYLLAPDLMDEHELSAKLLDREEVLSAMVSDDMVARVDNMMNSLNIIVYLVIACAAVLSFVVVYNLTNINISERVREIATIKVLGFYMGETAAYVFRENILLSILGAAVGLGLGKLLHIFIMSEVKVDMITFDVKVNALSYLIAFVLSILFTLVVGLFMNRKLDHISMTESLKAVE